MSHQNTPKKHLKPVAKSANITPDSDEYRYEDDFLAIALIDEKARSLIEEVNQDYLSNNDRKEAFNYVKTAPKNLQNAPEYVKILSLRADARYAGWSEQDRHHEAARLLRRIKDEYKKQQKDVLTESLRLAETNGDEEAMREILQKIQALNKEIYS